MNVPHSFRALIPKRNPRPVVNSPYPPSGRSGYPVANAQAGAR
jgi:hypothetical protein